MANIAIFRINYKSDFILTLNSDAGWLTPFCIKFWTGAPSQAYFVGFDGTTYTHCAPVAGEPTKLLVQFDDHHLPIGDLKFQIGYHFTVADFPTSVEDEVINQASVIIEVDDAPAQVMLDFNGETAPEIEFNLPAFANEAQRIENEQQRIENEQQRIDNEQQRIGNEQTRQRNEETRIENEQERVREFGQMKGDLEQATRDAAAAAENAYEKGVYAKNQGDYAKQQGDYAKQQGDTAQADHERAEDDHRIAGEDHTQAGSDHTRAGEDHIQAGSDHTRAGEDHTRAGDDHTRADQDHARAESDHAAVEVYVDSLGAFDISAYHATGGVLAKYADLTAALGTNGANVPDALRKGGMSVKFVQSSDNKYVQYRLMSDTFNTTVANWQGVDDEPTAGSKSLIESGGVFKFLTDYSGIYVSAGGDQYAEVDIPTSIAPDYDNSGLVVGKEVKFKLPIMFANQTVELRGRNENHAAIGSANISLNANAEGNVTVISSWYYIRFRVGAEGNVVQIYFNKSMEERLNNTEQRVGTLEEEINPLNKIVFGVYTSAKGDTNAEIDIPTSIASDYDNNGLIIGKQTKFKLPIMFANQTVKLRGRSSTHGIVSSVNVTLNENAEGYVTPINTWYYIRFNVGAEGNVVQIFNKPIEQHIDEIEESNNVRDEEINILNTTLLGIYTSEKGDENGEVDIPTSNASDYDNNGFIVGKKVYFKMPISYASQTISVRGRASDHSATGSTDVSLDENAIGYVVVNSLWYYIRFVVGIGNTMQVYSEPLKDMVIKNKESIEELNVTRKLVSGASTSNTVFGDALQLKDIEPELKYTTVYPNTGNHQGMAVYDNKIFAFDHGGSYKVSNLSDGTQIYAGSLVADDSFHCGSVDFLKNHLSAADKPLFFVSWNNSPRADFYELNSDQSSTFVMSVTYNGTAITNLAQGSSFAYDENNGIVYMVARWNGTIMSNKNKTDLTIFAFRVNIDFENPVNVSLTDEMLVESTDIPYLTLQSISIKNDKLYILGGMYDDFYYEGDPVNYGGYKRVFVFDVYKKIISSVINLEDISGEPEDFAIYKGNMYYTVGSGYFYKL